MKRIIKGVNATPFKAKETKLTERTIYKALAISLSDARISEVLHHKYGYSNDLLVAMCHFARNRCELWKLNL